MQTPDDTPAQTQPNAEPPERIEQAPTPALWNPNAAANWSLLFSPLFGAVLHAKNWRALNHPDRVKANQVWAGISIVFLVGVLASFFIPESRPVDMLIRYCGLGLLFGWYFTQGRQQAQFVKQTLGKRYRKRPWALPLLSGLAGLAVYFLACMLLAAVTFTYDPDELADELTPEIRADWQQAPEPLSSATIKNVSLQHVDGDNYAGTIDAVIDGQPQQIRIEVEASWYEVVWEIMPAGI